MSMRTGLLWVTQSGKRYPEIYVLIVCKFEYVLCGVGEGIKVRSKVLKLYKLIL